MSAKAGPAHQIVDKRLGKEARKLREEIERIQERLEKANESVSYQDQNIVYTSGLGKGTNLKIVNP